MKAKILSRYSAPALLLCALGLWSSAQAQAPVPENQPPSVKIANPINGQVFLAPSGTADVMILAEARDTDGWVKTVEFLANSNSLVVITNNPMSAGPRNPFSFVWTNVTAGDYELLAKATDDAGAASTSPPVKIRIVDATSLPIVTVVATDPVATEQSPLVDAKPDTGLFTVHRTGDLTQDLNVRYALGGTAENGMDYQKLSGWVNIPAGSATADILVDPIDDELTERTETVVIHIEPPLLTPAEPAMSVDYLPGVPREATVFIRDNDQPASPPFVHILRPENRQIFTNGAPIEIVAAAVDLADGVSQVEFFDGGVKIGDGAPLPTPTPMQGGRLFSLVWRDAALGHHVLTAKATDAAGTTAVSDPVELDVVDPAVTTVVTIEATDPVATEPGVLTVIDTAEFTVHRTGDLSHPTTVFYTTGGKAQNGVDYQTLPGVVTIAEGEDSQTILLTALQDNLVEGPEDVVLTLVFPITDPPGPVPPVDYLIGTPASAKAVIRDSNLPADRPPKVEIIQPQCGKVFTGPRDIEITAVARDPDGWVPKVEFYSGDKKIGESIIVFIQEPPPGQSQTFSFVWTNVPPGAYVLRAKATDDQNQIGWSEPVCILVVSSNPLPVVSIVTADPVAIEPSSATTGNPAEFVVHRTGDLAEPMTVFYHVGGTAENGIDYTKLSGEVTIPASNDLAHITVDPLADDLVERPETVVLELDDPACATIVPPPPGCYRLGELHRAEAVILDRTEPTNRPPRVAILRPYPDEMFQAPADVKIVVRAWDPDGQVTKVEFYADDQKIGEQPAPDPIVTPLFKGSVQAFSLVWSNAPVGKHVLTAQATDDDGAVTTSKPVGIAVIEGNLPPLVRILATDPYAAERPDTSPPNTATFKVRRTGATNEALQVWYALGGTAVNGKDYQELTGTVTIPAGKRSARITVVPLNDDLPEPVETVVCELSPSPTVSPIDPYHIGRPARAVAVIVDNDGPQPPIRRLTGGTFHVCLPGDDGMPYRIEGSNDLVNWMPLGDGLAAGGQVQYAEPAGGDLRARFYRAVPVVMEALDLDDD
jgi:hypothetical protein